MQNQVYKYFVLAQVILLDFQLLNVFELEYALNRINRKFYISTKPTSFIFAFAILSYYP